ncbi:Aminotransferase, partial [Aspergillus sclerotialis]
MSQQRRLAENCAAAGPAGEMVAAAGPRNPVCGLDELQTLLSEKTRIVACPHASNITGTITDVKKIATLVHRFPR